MQVLLIKGGVVDNCIEADSVELALQYYPDHICIKRTSGMTAGPGDTFDGVSFTTPAPAPVVREPISKLTFLSRFPTAKRIAIRQAVTSDPIIADCLGLLDMADNVATDHADTQAMVGYLVSTGYLTSADAAVILE